MVRPVSTVKSIVKSAGATATGSEVEAIDSTCESGEFGEVQPHTVVQTTKREIASRK